MRLDVEAKMSSVERVLEYAELIPEAERIVEPRPAAEWPTQGKIELRDVCMRSVDCLVLLLGLAPAATCMCCLAA